MIDEDDENRRLAAWMIASSLREDDPADAERIAWLRASPERAGRVFDYLIDMRARARDSGLPALSLREAIDRVWARRRGATERA